jgi:tRNA dimethylallyltransferase
MKRRTRNYARRQLTWMRKLAGVTVIDRTDRPAQAVADEIFTHWRAAPQPAAALRRPPRTDT